MHAFDVLGDPVRRRILELLAEGELTSGAIGAVVQQEFGITQPAVSQHLKVLRDSGMVTVRGDAQRRIYALEVSGLDELEAWLACCRRFWAARLDTLERRLQEEERGT